MHAHAHAPSRVAVWWSLETNVDRWTSFAALGVGLVACATALVVL